MLPPRSDFLCYIVDVLRRLQSFFQTLGLEVTSNPKVWSNVGSTCDLTTVDNVFDPDSSVEVQVIQIYEAKLAVYVI